MKQVTGTWATHEASAPRRAARWATSDRGWLFVKGENTCRGHYLDYGSEHYRNDKARAAQPGNVLAVSVRTYHAATYFETVPAAKAWLESLNPDITRVVERFRNGARALPQLKPIGRTGCRTDIYAASDGTLFA